MILRLPNGDKFEVEPIHASPKEIQLKSIGRIETGSKRHFIKNEFTGLEISIRNNSPVERKKFESGEVFYTIPVEAIKNLTLWKDKWSRKFKRKDYQKFFQTQAFLITQNDTVQGAYALASLDSTALNLIPVNAQRFQDLIGKPSQGLVKEKGRQSIVLVEVDPQKELSQTQTSLDFDQIRTSNVPAYTPKNLASQIVIASILTYSLVYILAEGYSSI